MKLLVAPRAVLVVHAMGEAGFLEPVLAGMGYPGRFGRLEAIEGARGDGPDPTLRLMALAVAKAEDAQRLRDRLRLTNVELCRMTSAAEALASLRGLKLPLGERALKALLFTRGRGAVRDGLTLVQVETPVAADDRAFGQTVQLLCDTEVPRCPFGGRDVIARGIPAGPKVSQVLRTFDSLWLEADFPANQSIIGGLLDAAIKKVSRSRSGNI